jgi:acyl-coenzyme A thioesterase PaaI-like protein
VSGVEIFTRAGAAFLPTGHAVGPWDPTQLHGGAPCALLAEAIQALAPDQQLARCTFEFLGPVPLGPLELSAMIRKPGRRFQLAEAELTAGGRPVLLARAVLLRRAAPLRLPEPARWPAALPVPPPDACPPMAGAWVREPGQEGFHLTGMELRDAGSPAPGRAAVWFRLAGALVAGHELLPAARAVAVGDFGNGIANVLDFRTHLFVNTDLSVALVRDPVGEWILLEATTRIDPAGIGVARSTLYDERGPVGTAQQTLFVQVR